MPYISLDNLMQYNGRLRDYIDGSFDKLDGANWRKTSAGQSVSCWPIPESPLEPEVTFKFSEVPPASGTKGPDNPSTIVGVSSVKATRCGKNLLVFPYYSSSFTSNGVTFTVGSDGSVSTSGTASGDVDFYIASSSNGPWLSSGLSYTLSGCPSGGSTSTYYIRHSAYSTAPDTGSGATFTASASGKPAQPIIIRIKSGTNTNNLVFRPQLELGTTATPFEPYDGADYTIDLGGTYYGGTVNFATGVMEVTHGVLILDGTENWSTPTQVVEGIYRHGFTRQNGSMYSLGSNGESSCTHFNYIYNANAPQISYYLGSYSAQHLMYVNMKTSFSTVEAQKAWLASEYSAGHPVTITGLLYAPFTVPLTPVLVRSLPALSHYTPRQNTIYTPHESVQVGYAKSASKTSQDLANAIVALGGNV